MPDRTRPIRKEICLNEQELNLIQHKMHQLGTHNFGAYARKMLIDGYIIKVDYTEQKKLAAAVSRAASNINQICRRINSTGRCYEDDVAELKARQAEIWELLKMRQRAESKIRTQTALGRRQFRVEKPLNGKHSRTAKAAQQYDFPRSREIEFYLST